MIGPIEIMAAIDQHGDMLNVDSPEAIGEVMTNLTVDHVEVASAIGALIDTRDVPVEEQGTYAGAFFDGFVLGIRADRESRKNEDAKKLADYLDQGLIS